MLRFNRKALQYSDIRAYELRARAIFDGIGSRQPWFFHIEATNLVLHRKSSELAASNTHHNAPSAGMEASTGGAVMRPKKFAYNDLSTRFSGSLLNSKYGGHVIWAHVASTSSTGMRTCYSLHFSYGCDSWAKSSFGSYPSQNLPVRYSSSANVEDQARAGRKGSNARQEMPKSERTQDSQREEMMGFMVERDISAVANELRQAQQEMLVNMRKCCRALFAVGTIHLIWGITIFSALEWPLDHAVMIEICMSGLVFCALAYQMKQTIKPVQFFTNLEEQLKIIFLSRQVSRMLGAFFHRGSGIGFVLACTLAAHACSCIRFLL